MHSKGVDGIHGVTASVAGCDGALRQQWAHESLILLISWDIPGQKTIERARASIMETPWCAE